MISNFFYTFLSALIFVSCNAQKKKTHWQSKNLEVSKTLEKPIIRLKEGENQFLKDKQMNITFRKVISDNRCPTNAKCVSAGNAIVEIEVMMATSRPKNIKLSTDDINAEIKNSTIFSDYIIKLENLYPSHSKEIDFEKLKGKYWVELSIEKIKP